MSVEEFRSEVEKKERFEFGKNWKNFLEKINTDRIDNAEKSLCAMLGDEDLSNKAFLDIGSGSGLSSLAARNRGGIVTSFDFDDSSVWCTTELKNRFYPNSSDWKVIQGSILDSEFLSSLAKFDIVYSWGVLHHTGQMWLAIDNSIELVEENGVYFIAIYNDQGMKSRIWWLIKFVYNKLPKFLRKPFAYSLGFCVQFLTLIKYTIKLKPSIVLSSIFNYKKSRGMSLLSDINDWYGGFPFEFAKYEHLVNYVENKGFELVRGKEAGSLGCHELVFKRIEK